MTTEVESTIAGMCRIFRRVAMNAAALCVLLLVVMIGVGSHPAPTVAASNGSIAGIVTHGTFGEPVPDAVVTLSRFASQTDVVDTSTATDALGAYSFTGLDTASGFVYVTSVTHHDIIYASGMLRINEQPRIDANLTIYET